MRAYVPACGWMDAWVLALGLVKNYPKRSCIFVPCHIDPGRFAWLCRIIISQSSQEIVKKCIFVHSTNKMQSICTRIACACCAQHPNTGVFDVHQTLGPQGMQLAHLLTRHLCSLQVHQSVPTRVSSSCPCLWAASLVHPIKPIH